MFQPLVQSLLVLVTDVEELPHNVTITNNKVNENSPSGTIIGEFFILLAVEVQEYVKLSQPTLA